MMKSQGLLDNTQNDDTEEVIDLFSNDEDNDNDDEDSEPQVILTNV